MCPILMLYPRRVQAKTKTRALCLTPKQIGNTYFHMQGAGLNVLLKVYMLHNMHPGNMWNVG